MVTAIRTGTRPFTYEDLLEFPEGDGYRYEIIGGELFVTAAPGRKHQRVAYRFSQELGDHVDARGLGEVYFAPVDVRLHAHDIVQPDLLFISKERLEIFAGNVVEGAPDIVVEILSPSTRSRDLTFKLSLYASSGVREYWLVDPEARSVTLYAISSSGGYQRLEAVRGHIRSTVLPDFVLDVNALFADLD